jgi:hypothetical protein
MQRITIDPFALVAGDTGATSATRTKSIYLPYVDPSRPIKATWKVTGTFGGATVAGKFVESDDNSSFTDVTGGGFVSVTSATPTGGVVKTFTLGTTLQINTGAGFNYGKYLAFSYTTSGGTNSVLAITVALEDIFMPGGSLTFKLY